MAKLKFPDDGPVEQDLFRNINGDGGKAQMIIGMIGFGVITGIIGSSLVAIEEKSAFLLLPITCILLVWLKFIHSYRNVIVVEHSPDALRVQHRGECYEIPYSEVYRITEENWWFRSMYHVGDGMAESRKIKVELKTKQAFGHAFSFWTKRDYSTAEDVSCVTRLLQQYADKAAGR